MRYHANISENIINAGVSKDKDLLLEIVLDEIATMIQENPEPLIEVLQESNVKISSTPSKEDLINAVTKNIYRNRDFQKNLSLLFAKGVYRQPAREEFAMSQAEYHNQDGGGGGGEGGGGGNIVASVADMVGSIADWGKSGNELKAAEAGASATLYSKIFGDKTDKKTWLLPAIALAGVLLIGGLVVWRVTGKNN
jgi:hypothetical protein